MCFKINYIQKQDSIFKALRKKYDGVLGDS